MTIGMTPYEALHGHKCRSPSHWDEVSEAKLLGSKILQQTAVAQSRQKNYTDIRLKDLEFTVIDKVFI